MTPISIRTTTGGAAEIPRSRLARLDDSLKGRVVTVHDDDYETVRAVWNGMIDARPAVFVLCRSAQDVTSAVQFAAAGNLRTSVRSGGHNVSGAALNEGGIVIDTGLMRSVRVDTERRIARVDAGARLGDIDRETRKYGLVTPSGFVSETGMAGLSLRGGLGHLMRRFGLSCDNMTAAELVTTDGRTVRASDDENQDLLWALRGGGVDLGVVTAFEFRLHELGPDVQLVMPVYPAAAGREALRFLRESMRSAPDELGMIGFYGTLPDDDELPSQARGADVFVFYGCYSGPEDQQSVVTDAFRSVVEPLVDFSARMPYTDVQTYLNDEYPDGRRYYWRSVYLDELDDATIEMLHDHASRRPSTLSTLDVWFMGGSIAEMDADAAAFSQRGVHSMIAIESNWQDPDDDDANIAWARKIASSLEARSPHGGYLNFAGTPQETQAALEVAHGANIARLRDLKRRYDPSGLFGG